MESNLEITLKETNAPTGYVRLSAHAADGTECGRVFLFLIKNDLHTEPYGFVEDVFVEEAHRKSGVGRALMARLIEVAKERGCYKLLATSRHEREGVHAWYERLGFKPQGIEFRMDLLPTDLPFADTEKGG